MRTLNEELLALRSELMAVGRTNGDLRQELRRAKLGAPAGDEVGSLLVHAADVTRDKR